MISKSSLMKFLLIFSILLLKKCILSEWIEMPEFSDNEKVYRVPFNKYEREKLTVGYVNAHKYAFPNNSSNYFNKNIELSTEKTLMKIQTTTTTAKQEIFIEAPKVLIKNINNSTKSSDKNEKSDDKINNIRTNVNNNNSNKNNNISDGKIVNKTTDNHDNEKNEETEDNDEDASVTSNNEQNDEKLTTTINQEDNNPDKNKQANTFLSNLPVELFKKVHRTLMESRPTSVRGKLEFLATIKRTLLNAIQTKLMALVSPIRRKRGSGGWEEDHVGFPSLEGALLAISFLTFAVYLVQLVMMLFRNLGPPPSTTQTVVVNRNKRQSADLTDESTRILQYLEEFRINQKNNTQH